MNPVPYLRAGLAVPFIALLSACGGPKQSPQTWQYLKQVTAAVDEMDRTLSQVPIPNAPLTAKLSKEKAEDAEALKKLSRELIAYYSDAEKMTKAALPVYDQAQSKISGLDTAGVDPLATALGDRYSGLSDRRQQLALNLQAFVSSQRMELSNGNIWLYAPKLAASGVAMLVAPANGDAGGAFEPTAEERSEMDAQAISVQHAIVQWRSDAAAIASLRNDLLTALKLKYPGNDWSFLAAR